MKEEGKEKKRKLLKKERKKERARNLLQFPSVEKIKVFPPLLGLEPLLPV